MQGDGAHTRGIDEFRIGDFVWGKIDGQLWWPGRVCDPSDASKEARCLEHVDHNVLVAYFGDDTFAWCEASLLRPFREEFQEIVEQNTSQSFIDALKDAMYEVEICLRADMTCCCVPLEKVAHFRTSNATVSNYSPAEFLHHLQDIAQDISDSNMLEVALMRSWASSFYIRNGCFIKMVEDLFDEKQTDLDALPGKLFKDEQGRELDMNGGRVVRRPQICRDESSRKKKSIAELILLANPELLQRNVAEEEKLGTLDDETQCHSNPGLLQNKKKKRRDRVNDKVIDVEVMNDDENGSTRRERKKSKYLSPPYINQFRERSNSFKLVDSEASETDSESSSFPTCIEGNEASIKEGGPVTHSSINTEASTHDFLGEFLSAASNPLHLARNTLMENVREFFVKHRSFAYSGILHQNGEKPIKDKATSETRKTSNYSNGVDASKARLKSRGRRGANESVSVSVENITHMVSNTAEEGRLEKKRNKTKYIVKDGNSMNSESEHHERKSNDDASNNEENNDFDHIKNDDSGKSVSRSKRTRQAETSNAKSVALLLTFSPGSTLPSKGVLFSVFGKYGALIKHETELFTDPGCARVVFARGTDAEKAMKRIKKNNGLPFSVVDCQSFDLPQCPDISSWPESDPSAELKCISRDLQRMVSTLSPKKGLVSHGLKPEARKELISDIKSLLDKVNNLMTL